MDHQIAVDLLGTCPCTCHQGNTPECWCHTSRPDPLPISHNDRVRHLGRCDCARTQCSHHYTSPELRTRLEDLEVRRRDERIRTGRLRSSDLTHIAKNPARYPHLFRNRRPEL
jgi:hypothetical protein